MKYVIFFTIVILSFYLKKKIFDKTDKEMEEYYKTDGHAKFIRNSFPNLIDEIIRITSWDIFKERDDAIFIGCKETEYIGLLQRSGNLKIVYIKHNTLIKSWSFKQYTDNDIIIEELTKYII